MGCWQSSSDWGEYKISWRGLTFEDEVAIASGIASATGNVVPAEGSPGEVAYILAEMMVTLSRAFVAFERKDGKEPTPEDNERFAKFPKNLKWRQVKALMGLYREAEAPFRDRDADEPGPAGGEAGGKP